MTRKSTHPRWVGILLALLLPGSAHYLSGQKTAGIKWLLVLILASGASLNMIAIPTRATIAAGIAIGLVLVPILFLVMLFKSYRPTRRIGFKGWIFFILLCFCINTIRIHLAHITINPYKIPTNAMQPTLRGITTDNATKSTSFMDWVMAGENHVEVHATATGRIENMQATPDGFVFSIGGVQHNLPLYALETLRPMPHATQGDILWAGTVYSGDHIMVEKTSYWFGEPHRGDVIVFKTEHIDHPSVRKDTVYIKRIVATPGDTIAINPPHILINDKPLSDPAIFSKLEYGNGGQLAHPTNTITLGENEFFVLGDNTAPGRSLDSRHFEAIPRESIIGRVSTIYWPFNRMGVVE